jgi:hypothetical protein
LLTAIVHIPLVLLVLATFPIWVAVALKPQAYEKVAIRLLRELRGWSCAVLDSRTAKGKANAS